MAIKDILTVGTDGQATAGGAGLNEQPVKNYLKTYANAGASVTVTTGLTDTIATSDRTANKTNWGASNTALLTIASDLNSELRSPYSYLITEAGSSSGAFIESPLFTLDQVDIGKPVSVSFDLKGNAVDGDYQTYIVRYNSSNILQSRIVIAGNASSTSPFSAKLPTGTTTFNGFFVPDTTSTDHQYALRVVSNNNSAASLRVDTLFIGPQPVRVGNARTARKSYTPTGPYVSNVTYVGRWQRDNEDILLDVGLSFTDYTTASNALFTYTQLLNGLDLTVDTSKLPNANFHPVGNWNILDALSLSYGGEVVADGTQIWLLQGSGNVASNTSPITIGNADTMNFTVRLPISQWSSNVTMADRAVEEYGSTSGTWDADSSTTVIGAQGTQIGGALTAERNKTITWPTSIQPTDRFVVELSEDQIQWHDADGYTNNTTAFICATTLSSTGTFASSAGVFVAKATSANQTRVTFCRYASMANDDTPTGNWVSGIYWRVRKVSGGAQVGYPISPNNLVKSIARYTTAAGQSISHNTMTTVDYGTKDYDVKGEVTTGASWKFTAAQTGYYRVQASLLFTNTTAFAESEYVEFDLFKNGSFFSCLDRPNGRDFSGGSEHMYASGGDIIYLVAGDYISFGVLQTSGGTVAIHNNAAFNFASIEQIG